MYLQVVLAPGNRKTSVACSVAEPALRMELEFRQKLEPKVIEIQSQANILKRAVS